MNIKMNKKKKKKKKEKREEEKWIVGTLTKLKLSKSKADLFIYSLIYFCDFYEYLVISVTEA